MKLFTGYSLAHNDCVINCLSYSLLEPA